MDVMRETRSRRRSGAFSTVREYSRLPLTSAGGLERHPDHLPKVSGRITIRGGRRPVHFTLADLSSLNILAHGDVLWHWSSGRRQDGTRRTGNTFRRGGSIHKMNSGVMRSSIF